MDRLKPPLEGLKKLVTLEPQGDEVPSPPGLSREVSLVLCVSCIFWILHHVNALPSPKVSDTGNQSWLCSALSHTCSSPLDPNREVICCPTRREGPWGPRGQLILVQSHQLVWWEQPTVGRNPGAREGDALPKTKRPGKGKICLHVQTD